MLMQKRGNGLVVTAIAFFCVLLTLICIFPMYFDKPEERRVVWKLEGKNSYRIW
jgi:hypothetical protein